MIVRARIRFDETCGWTGELLLDDGVDQAAADSRDNVRRMLIDAATSRFGVPVALQILA